MHESTYHMKHAYQTIISCHSNKVCNYKIPTHPKTIISESIMAWLVSLAVVWLCHARESWRQ